MPEPLPAHEDEDRAIQATGAAIDRHLSEIERIIDGPGGMERLLALRYDKYRRIGAWQENQLPDTDDADSR